MSTVFETVTEAVSGRTSKTVKVPIQGGRISNATVTVQGFNLFNVDHPNGHFRGPTRLQITNISYANGREVHFEYLYEFAEGENDHWPMKGIINFLVIAITD